MTTLLRIIILGLLLFLLAQLVWLRFRVGLSLFGKPTIPRRLFVLAKLSMIISLLCVVLQAWLGNQQPSTFLTAVFLCLWIGGGLLVAVSIRELGRNLRMGIPAERTFFITSGVYGFSRNPIYLGLFCLLAASLIRALSWLNIVAVLTAVILHHRIVLAEEEHLARSFPEFEPYRASVRRYV